MNKFSKRQKIVFIILAALVVGLSILIYKSAPVQTVSFLSPVGKPFQKESVKSEPAVLVTRDSDGYGLQIMSRGFSGVKKVEMLVGYTYNGKQNPSMVAAGAPQQESFWAHFRFESCSRGDCVKYKVNEAKFQLTLNYLDGESKNYTSVIKIPEVSKETLISLSPTF